ncbi:MAG: glycosyltransferase family 2 protein [Bacteroidales bacterium]|nr:glycosyltransferase family 2 protein [Bacteroidales bacterium]
MSNRMLSIIIPVYNEESQVGQLLHKIFQLRLNYDFQKEIIIVDDASQDGTLELVRSVVSLYPHHNVKIIEQKINCGKGYAIQLGIEQATGDYIIIQDADNELDPNDINEMLQPVVDGYADVVFSSRFLGNKPRRVLSYWHMKGNKFMTWLSNLFTGLSLTDITSCYKLIRSDLAKRLFLNEKRFGIDPELVAKIRRFPNVRIYEVGIAYYARGFHEGKKIRFVRDGLRQIWVIIKYNIFCRKYEK